MVNPAPETDQPHQTLAQPMRAARHKGRIGPATRWISVAVAILLLFHPRPTDAEELESGFYENMVLSVDKHGDLSGRYRDSQGEGVQKTCSFYFKGKAKGGIAEIITWSDRELPGVLKAVKDGVELKVPNGQDHAGCGLVLLPQIADGIVLDLLQRTALHDAPIQKIAGRWVKKGANAGECVCGECIDIPPDGNPLLFCVESNQIYVHAHYQLNLNQKTAYLLFDDVAEVGTGGAALPWEKFDKHQPLAEIDISRAESGTIRVIWFGFRQKGFSAGDHPLGEAYAGTYEGPKPIRRLPK